MILVSVFPTMFHAISSYGKEGPGRGGIFIILARFRPKFSSPSSPSCLNEESKRSGGSPLTDVDLMVISVQDTLVFHLFRPITANTEYTVEYYMMVAIF